MFSELELDDCLALELDLDLALEPDLVGVFDDDFLRFRFVVHFMPSAVVIVREGLDSGLVGLGGDLLSRLAAADSPLGLGEVLEVLPLRLLGLLALRGESPAKLDLMVTVLDSFRQDLDGDLDVERILAGVHGRWVLP